ncbi:MAG: peptidase M22 [Oscillospiraceae bacterium]|nr:peptidase M22 [Oscillospiraceae bacterium]
MGLYLGLDTSNYTTSAALYNSATGEMLSEKLMLPVKPGERGIRQSNAVFHHTKQLPTVVKRLFDRVRENAVWAASTEANSPEAAFVKAIASSVCPRDTEGSYMPCFLCGEGLGECMAAAGGYPFYKLSHQTGHILAAVFSADRLGMLQAPFIAFHVSGGTTDCLLCSPDPDNIIKIEEISSSLDLKAGQLIDRAGVMMGLTFPCGIALEKLSEKADKQFKIRPVIKNGSCCLSGYENEVKKLIEKGEAPENTARFVLDAVEENIAFMTEAALDNYGNLPVIFAGGVMSNKYIGGKLKKRFDSRTQIYFGEAEYSRDNAAGAAMFAYLKSGG